MNERSNCDWCKTAYDRHQWKQRFCSSACCAAWRVQPIQQLCVHCNEPYSVPLNNAKRQRFCSIRCAKEHLYQVESPRPQKYCEWCLLAFQHPGTTARFCSKSCAQFWKNRKKWTEERRRRKLASCAYCGASFRQKHQDTRCCSKSCARRLYWNEHPRGLPKSQREERILVAGGIFFQADVRRLWVEQAGRCAYCGTRLRKGKTHRDHIVALARGGDNDISNICLACKNCNERKRELSVEEFLQRNPALRPLVFQKRLL